MGACSFLPEVYHLSQLRWDYFGTLTWRSLKRHNERSEQSAHFLFWRRVCEGWGVHMHRLVWCVRSELGESFGRPHLHFLLAQSGADLNASKIGGYWLESLWPFGFAEVRLYDARRNGALYVTECLTGASGVGASAYELQKTASALGLRFSEGLTSLLRARLFRNRRVVARWQKGS